MLRWQKFIHITQKFLSTRASEMFIMIMTIVRLGVGSDLGTVEPAPLIDLNARTVLLWAEV
ncbi:MAG: hypothetical protein ACREGG_00620 [Candidatus Saccharimonadales bacterium]